MQAAKEAVFLCILLGLPEQSIGGGARFKDYKATTRKTMDLKLTENSDGKTIDLKTGQQFTIALEENPTTGYRWYFVGNGAPVISLMGDSFQASSHQLGSPGVHEWQLRAESPGQVTIEMKLARGWDRHNPTRSLVIHLKVT